jgi:hypothetical protein
MNPCNEIKIVHPLKLECDLLKLKCDCDSKNLKQNYILSDQLLVFKCIIYEKIFPELIARTSRMKPIQINKRDALIEHNDLEEFFKKNIHLYHKNNQICLHLSLLLINRTNLIARSIFLIDNIEISVSVQEFIQIETNVWNIFLTKIFEANDMELTFNKADSY